MPHHPFLFVVALFFCLCVIATVFWIAMIIDCAKNPRLSESSRIGWLLVIVLTHLLGAFLYFFIGRSRTRTAFIPPNSSSYVRPYQRSTQPPAYYRPQPPRQAAAHESYHEYRQGYGAVPQAERPPQQASEAANWKHYEEPQSAYPQLPQQELPPQTQHE